MNGFRWRRETPLAGILLLLVVAVSIAQPRFLSPENLRSILLWLPLLVIVALGEMTVILTRGIDVSVGSMLGLSGMMTAMLLRDHPEIPVPVAALFAMAAGGGLGAINGGLVAGVGIPPIVATLATLGIYRGATFLVSGGKQVDDYQLPRALAGWSSDGPFGADIVPYVVWIALLAAVAMQRFLTDSRTGRDWYAIGGDPDGAADRGVAVRPRVFLAYVFSGVGSGLAGLLYASRFGTVNPASIGNGFELLVISATVIGGVSIFGGSGTVAGVLLGSLLLGTISVALAVLNIAETWQSAVYGAVLLAALLADDAMRRRLEREERG
ncbi:MAG: ABC transporter permease [Capsulimonadales bacterium]|nr:ABC transporter permease [Capsulimonadales bacterium]